MPPDNAIDVKTWKPLENRDTVYQLDEVCNLFCSEGGSQSDQYINYKSFDFRDYRIGIGKRYATEEQTIKEFVKYVRKGWNTFKEGDDLGNRRQSLTDRSPLYLP